VPGSARPRCSARRWSHSCVRTVLGS
jgi:hypothetical protein